MSGNNSAGPWLPFSLAGGSPQQTFSPDQLALLQQNQAALPPSAQAPWPQPPPQMTWHQQQVADYLNRRLSPSPAPTYSDSPRANYGVPVGMGGELGVRAMPVAPAFQGTTGPSPQIFSDSPTSGYYATGTAGERPYLLPNEDRMGGFNYNDPSVANMRNPITSWLRDQWNGNEMTRYFGPWLPPHWLGT